MNATVVEYDYDVIALTETWLDESTTDAMLLNNFTVFRNDRKGRGGGTLIAVKKCIKCFRYSLDTELPIEATAVIIESKNPALLICIYIPPDDISKNLLNNIDNIVSGINPAHGTTVIVGDFNINVANISNPFSIQLDTIFAIYGYDQLISSTTRSSSNTIIDLLYTNNKDALSGINVIDNISSSCDHNAIELRMSMSDQECAKKAFTKYMITDDGIEKFKNILSSCDWDTIIQRSLGMDDMFNEYEKICNKAMKDSFVEKKVSTVHKVMNKTIAKLLHKKRKLFRRMKQNRDDAIEQEIKTIYEQIKMNIAIEKKLEMEKIFSRYPNLNSLFKYIKAIKNNSTSNTLLSNGMIISQDADIAEVLANSFSQVYNNIGYSDSSEKYDCGEYEPLETDPLQISKFINQLKTKKSTGFSFNHTTVMKSCSLTFGYILSKMFNAMLKIRCIPSSMKHSKVTPIAKPGKDQMNALSYRPVSVDLIESKLLAMFLKSKLEDQNIELNCSQYGFVKKSNTTIQIIDVHHMILNNLENKKCIGVDVIFLDYSSAFDKVLINKLILSLKVHGVDVKICDMINEMHNGRKQTIVFNGQKSSPITPTSGVIQGGVCSPMLYNIYVDIVGKKLNSKIYKFADDTIIIRPIFDHSDIKILQDDINTVCSESTELGLKMNSSKVKHIRFGTRSRSLANIYEIDGQDIESVLSYKHLGYIFDCKLSMNERIPATIKSANRTLRMLNSICSGCDGWTFLKVYIIYVRPIIEYSFIVMEPSKAQERSIEFIQKNVTKRVINMMNFPYMRYNVRLRLLSIQSIESRRKYFLMKQCQKIYSDDNVPAHWTETLSFKTSTRNGMFIERLTGILNVTRRSFFYQIVNNFNNLPKNIRDQIGHRSFLNLVNDHYDNEFYNNYI